MRADYMVPVVTYPDPSLKAGLGAAIGLLSKLADKISIVVQNVDIPPINNVVAEVLIDVSAMAASAEHRSQEAGAALALDIASLAASHALKCSTETLVATPASFLDEVVDASRHHDATLIVLDQEEKTKADLAKAVLFGSGGPLLLCPSLEREAQLRSVMVAWDGSRAAARAVRDALPILGIAQSVTVLSASEDKPIGSAAIGGLQSFLEHHGIQSGYREVRLGGRATGLALQEEAAYTGAGLLVMGGYGHSRIRELVLGGVTASILQGGPLLPIFMSH
jgi:nucleotide-binding universal stress UspA family protein